MFRNYMRSRLGLGETTQPIMQPATPPELRTDEPTIPHENPMYPIGYDAPPIAVEPPMTPAGFNTQPFHPQVNPSGWPGHPMNQRTQTRGNNMGQNTQVMNPYAF